MSCRGGRGAFETISKEVPVSDPKWALQVEPQSPRWSETVTLTRDSRPGEGHSSRRRNGGYQGPARHSVGLRWPRCRFPGSFGLGTKPACGSGRQRVGAKGSSTPDRPRKARAPVGVLRRGGWWICWRTTAGSGVAPSQQRGTHPPGAPPGMPCQTGRRPSPWVGSVSPKRSDPCGCRRALPESRTSTAVRFSCPSLRDATWRYSPDSRGDVKKHDFSPVV